MDISTEPRPLHGISQSLSPVPEAAAPLACSPKSNPPAETHSSAQEPKGGEERAFCWAGYLPSCLFIELFLKLSQSFAKPLLICSCFSEMFKQNGPVKERQEHEPHPPQVLGSTVRAVALGNKQPAAMGHGRHCSRWPETVHCIPPTRDITGCTITHKKQYILTPLIRWRQRLWKTWEEKLSGLSLARGS